MNSYVIGIDIGGTKVAIGIVDEFGSVHAQTRIPTNLIIPPSEMIEQIVQSIHLLFEESGLHLEQVMGIGIGAPGPVDAQNGMITCPPNLPNWIQVPIVAELEATFGVPVRLENDASAAALAEKWVGAAQDNGNFVYMTISTGIGAGLYLDGRLITGSRGNAGDIGHMVIDPTKGTCPCGQKGCFEWLASGTAIARRGSEIMGAELTTKEVFDLYKEKHPKIYTMIDDVFTSIGIGCVTIINLFDPEKIVIGGGVSQAGAPLFTAVEEYVSRYALNPAGRKTSIVPAASGQHAGVIGAAALIIRNLKGVNL
jgi:glucokinase